MTERENRALYIAEECRKAGMTLAGAAGVLANVEAESAINPRNVQDSYEGRVGNDDTYTARVDNGSYHSFTTDAAGFGLAQWTARDRKALLLARAKKLGVSIGDFQMQVGLLIDEMRGYTRAWSKVTQSNNPYECGYAVCRYYEIPADTENQAQYRGGLAQKWYEWLVNAMHNGEESTIQETQPATQPAKKDDDGIPIPNTWPPRTIDQTHCSGWPEVKLMQASLLCHGYNLLVDGIWSTEVTKKLMAFQEAAGLQADGVCGPATWTALGFSKDLFRR